MNTEATQDNAASQSTGARLRAARERMGLTQQNVAERLCLKLSTIRDLEEDKSPSDLASTFLRGYIRSYARLVHIPEEELLPMMAQQAPVRAAKVEPMQSFSLGKRRKKRDGWLMIFTWLVLFVVIGLTGAWWWQNHKAAQEDLISLGQQNSSGSDNNSQSIPLSDSNASSGSDNSAQTSAPAQNTPDNNNAASNAANTSNSAPLPPTVDPSTAQNGSQPTQSSSADTAPAVVSPSQPPVGNNPAPASAPAENTGAAASVSDPNAVVMNFTGDCWLELTDSAGKKLFSGIQHNGGKLNLAGTPPYRLKIGAPAAVQIQYQGNSVDLSRFIRSNQVARLTLGAH